jgi:adenosylmethionine-8-amino-7-oxononanoate aminotransferase
VLNNPSTASTSNSHWVVRAGETETGVAADDGGGRDAQVSDLRGYGMLAGVQLTPGAAPAAKGHAVQAALFEAGLHVRTTGDAIIFAPALVAERADVDGMLTVLHDVLSRPEI